MNLRIRSRCVVPAALLGAVVTAASAGIPARVPVGLDVPGVQWEPIHRWSLAGVPLTHRPFSSSLSPVQLAAALSSQTKLFQRVMASGSRWILSGVSPGAHWLAEIRPTEAGAAGYVSALSTQAMQARPATGHVLAHHGLPWLPAAAAPVVSLKGSATPGPTQSLYRVTWPLPVLVSNLRAGLARHGWRPLLQGSHAALPAQWHQGSQRLLVSAHDLPDGNAYVYVQH